MGTDDDRLAVIPQFLQDFLEFKPASGIQAGRRFIQNEKLGIVDQRPGQAEPLLHAPGKLIHIALFLSLQMHHFQQMSAQSAGLPRLHAVGTGIEFQIFHHLQIVIHTEKIRHIADDLFQPVIILKKLDIINVNFSRIRFEKSRHDFHGRGLPGAVGPHKTEDLSPVNLQIQTVQRRMSAITLRQISDFQHGQILPFMIRIGSLSDLSSPTVVSR